MNAKNLFAFAAFFAAAFSARAVVPGEVSNVTLTLTGSVTNEVTNTDTLYQSTIKTIKYTNAMFLQDLLDEGNLGDATSIKGWKLVIVNTTPLLSDDNPTLAFYAVNGTDIVAIDPSRFSFNAGVGSSAEATKTTFDGGSNVTSLTSKFISLVTVTGTQPASGDHGAYDINLQGLASGSQKSSTVTVKSATGGSSQTDTYNLIGAVKVTSLSGNSVSEDDSSDATLIGGSISFAAFVATDISNYTK